MKAITVKPGTSLSLALEDRAEPAADSSTLLVQMLALGVCGTDREIISGQYGWAPPGNERLVLGHESLARVLEAPRGSDFVRGDLVVGIVRRPDPVPCIACGVGEWDMCRNGQYTEHGIKSVDGFGAERFRLDPSATVKVDPTLGMLGVLLEPASVLAKAWDHIDRIGHRTRSWKPASVLVTGAGPVGLLAALMGHQRGLEIHVFDHATAGGKPELVKSLGGTYHSSNIPAGLRPDIVIECTGSFNRTTVLNNDVVFGSVNANRRHYELAADALAAADRAWLGRLITRRVPLARWQEAFERRDDDIKVILTFDESMT